jgi:hypothetical protein
MGGEGHGSFVVVIAVEKLFGALLGAEVAAEGVGRAVLAGPLEADRALLEELVQLARIADETVHGRAVYTAARTWLLLYL